MAAEEPIPQLAQAEDGKKRGKRRGSTSQENLVQSTPVQQQQPTPEAIVSEPTDTIQADNIQPVENCVIRCDKECAFPGLCRRYIDENQNQLCDLGECLTI